MNEAELKRIALLYKAIGELDIKTIRSLINAGVNPLQNVVSPVGKPTINLFVEILKIGHADIVQIALDYALKNKIFIDLRKFPVETNSHTLNLLQFACVTCHVTVLKQLVEYAKVSKPKQNIEKILNTDLPLAHFIFKKLTPQLILANFGPNDTVSSLSSMRPFIQKWSLCKQRVRLPAYDGPVKIIWDGSFTTLDYLISIGLDIEARTKEYYSFPELVDLMAQCTSNLEDWNHVYENLIMRDVTMTSDYLLGNDGRVYGNFLVTNKLGQHPIPFEITFDFSELNDLVKRVIKAKQETAPVLVPLFEKHAANEKRLAVLEDKVDNLSEQRRADIRKALAGYPGAARCFNRLEKAIKTQLEARHIATTPIFTANATSQNAKVAKSAQLLFSLIAEGTPLPFANIITGITAAAVTYTTQKFAHRQNQGVFDATLGLELDNVSIDVAAILTSEAMRRYREQLNENFADTLAKNLSAKVVYQIERLFQMQNQAQLIAFLCDEALRILPAIEHRISDSTSAGSSAINNSPQQMVAYVGAQSFTPEKQSARKKKSRGFGCVIC